MATVKLDMRDPDTKAVVNGWADDTEYTIRTGSGPNRAIAEVVESPEEEETTTPETETESEGGMTPPTSAGASAVKKAMGAAY